LLYAIEGNRKRMEEINEESAPVLADLRVIKFRWKSYEINLKSIEKWLDKIKFQKQLGSMPRLRDFWLLESMKIDF